MMQFEPIERKKRDDDITKLVHRVLDDEGPEGSVALAILREKLKGRDKTLLIANHDNDPSDPLLWVVKNLEERLNAERRINSYLSAKLERIAKLALSKAGSQGVRKQA